MTRRPGPTLAERSARRTGVEPQRDEPQARAGGRHCWVVDASGHPGRWPGLLVEWRRAGDRWEGRVVYVLPEPAGSGTRLVERWVDADHLTDAR